MKDVKNVKENKIEASNIDEKQIEIMRGIRLSDNKKIGSSIGVLKRNENVVLKNYYKVLQNWYNKLNYKYVYYEHMNKAKITCNYVLKKL